MKLRHTDFGELRCLHFQMLGFDLDGKPLSQAIKRNVTSELQTIAAKVIKDHVNSTMSCPQTSPNWKKND